MSDTDKPERRWEEVAIKLAEEMAEMLDESDCETAGMLDAMGIVMTAVIDTRAKEKDLNVARQLMDNMKSNVLATLTRKGWE